MALVLLIVVRYYELKPEIIARNWRIFSVFNINFNMNFFADVDSANV